jgi:cyclophilin family peptidyl-prolyl cis-trans isomerase
MMTFSQQAGRLVGLVVIGVIIGGGLSPRAVARQAAPVADPAAEFDEALGHVKKLMADLTVLQAQYQQPKADKPALEARFEATKKVAEAAGARLEAAAIALLTADPTNDDAREIATAVMAGALESDDPEKLLAVAATLDTANAIDGDSGLLAASSGIILSRLDDAAAWLDKAEAAGADKRRVDQLRATLERDRPKVEAELATRKAEAEADDLPRVKLAIANGDRPVGEVVVELFENEAPNTVANFVSLVEKGFYDDTPFHRVIPGFMAQGGDPTGSGSGGPGHAIACECGKPGARLHFRGTLSMAHAGQDTGGSQFFLTFRPTEHLDGKHTVFGRVIEGDEVLAKITRTQDAQGQPVPGIKPDTIQKAEMVRKRDHAYVPQTLPDPKGR